MLIKLAFLIALSLTIWSMVEIVSPKIVYKLYQKIGRLPMSEHSAVKIIRIDGLVSWLIFSILTGYLYGKL